MRFAGKNIDKEFIIVIFGLFLFFVFLNNYKIYEEKKNSPEPFWTKEVVYDEGLHYSPVKDFLNCRFNIDFSDTAFLRHKPVSVRVTALIIPHETDISVPLVFHVKYTDKTILWRSFELQKFLIDTGVINNVSMVFYTYKFKFFPEYKAKFYFWNKDSSDFTVKRLKVEFFEDSIPEPVTIY